MPKTHVEDEEFVRTTKTTFSKTLFKLRKVKYPTVKEFCNSFASKTGITLSETTYSKWEEGKSIPDACTLLKICDFFHCDLDYLFGRIDTTTHAIEVIEKETGLSVPAIKKIIEWNNGDSRQKKWISYISKIFEHKDISDVMNNMSAYFMHSMIEVKALYNKHGQDAIDAIDMQTASLWKLQHDFTKIVEELGSKHRKQILNKEKQKSRR